MGVRVDLALQKQTRTTLEAQESAYTNLCCAMYFQIDFTVFVEQRVGVRCAKILGICMPAQESARHSRIYMPNHPSIVAPQESAHQFQESARQTSIA